MGWKNLGEKPVVDTPWFRLTMADVELPGGRRPDHYVLRTCPASSRPARSGRRSPRPR